MEILLIKRAQRFSPNSVERDEAIIQALAANLTDAGHELTMVTEEEFSAPLSFPLCFHMVRSAEALALLAEMEQQGCRVINSVAALQHLSRRNLLLSAKEHGIGVPPFLLSNEEGRLPYPFWWKRDDHVSQTQQDVLLVKNDEQWQAILAMNVQQYVLEQHLQGDLIKFYGVRGTDFFHWNYPVFSKFGKEEANGQVAGIAFDAVQLVRQADKMASVCGLTVYGGDAIVTNDGRTYIIDFNDWPSFSSCRDNAARAIASLTIKTN